MEKQLAPRTKQTPSTHISEVILENFMSYEYSKIPLKKGLNIICGPNGAGKSSILLGISVALGQAYTERSRKLSDLIRRGKDTARVSLMFDNRAKEGRRPIPFYRSDTFMLSRYLKSDGSYWFEADYKEISKNDVTRLFNRIGLNPDNLLIIMHQGMVEEFSVTSPQDKLKMLEEAVGFKAYRENILEAQEKLSMLVSEEVSLLQIIESAGQTLDYWKGMYERYLTRRSLLEKKSLLEREYVWAQVRKHEKTLENLREKLGSRSRVYEDVKEKIEKTSQAVAESHRMIAGFHADRQKLSFFLVRLEKDLSKLKAIQQVLKDLAPPVEDGIALLSEAVASSEDYANRVTAVQERLRRALKTYVSDLDVERRQMKDIEGEIQTIQGEMATTEKKVLNAVEKHVSLRVEEALLKHEKREVEYEIASLHHSIQEVEEQLKALIPEVEKADGKLETERTPSEVLEELRVTGAHVQAYVDVPEDAERIYTSYTSTYGELKGRLEVVSENKRKALDEVKERKQVWRSAIQDLLNEVNPAYQSMLEKLNATGIVRLVEAEDFQEAGLEMLVGFRGAPVTVLDAYTQSGGERSISVMAFLLALQNNIISPFRAVDEFDVHMDPRNREAFFRMIFSHATTKDSAQYVAITPSQLTVMEPHVHIITVQNTYGRAEVLEVKERA